MLMHKRFSWYKSYYCGMIVDNLTKKDFAGSRECCNILNDLWEKSLRFEGYSKEKIKLLSMVDELVDGVDLKNHDDCKKCICDVSEITNGYEKI